MQGAPLGHNNFNTYQQPPQAQGGSFGMPQGFPGAGGGNAVGGAGARGFNGMSGVGQQMPAGMSAQPRPGAGGAPMTPMSAAPAGPAQIRGNPLGAQVGRVGVGMPGRPGAPPAGGGAMNGPRSGMPMGGQSAMGNVGNPVGRPGAVAAGGYNPSGDILAMLGKGQEHAETMPNFVGEDFPALGGGGIHRHGPGTAEALNGGLAGMGALSGIAAAKLPQDFQMVSEDFPALPAAMGGHGHDGAGGHDGLGGVQQQMKQMGHIPGGAGIPAPVSRPTGTQLGSSQDRFGLLGLLSVIQMTNPDLNTLALGTDLTTLGLNLNSTESLYSTFASPWADGPSRREPEFSLPVCYYMQPPSLKPGHIQKFQLETLFYIFYMLPKDTLQAVAASELYARDWKFHRELKMWFHKQPFAAAGMGADGKAAFSRPNTYIYFDVNVWERRTYYDANRNLDQGFLTEEEVRLK